MTRSPNFVTYFGLPHTPAFLSFPFWQWPPLTPYTIRQLIADSQTRPWAKA